MDHDQSQNAAPFPRPPPFYQQFTSDNLNQLGQHRNDRQAEHHDPSELSLEDTPPHLHYLIPPPPPTGDYTVFGDKYSQQEPNLPPLPVDIDRLVPTNFSPSGLPPYLLRLLRSILLSYLELTGSLAHNVEQAQTKVEDLRLLYLNAQRLINEYRQHQARETLIVMMKEQLSKKQAEVEAGKQMKVKTEALLRSFAQSDEAEDVQMQEYPTQQVSRSNEQKLGEQKRTWQVLEAISI